MYKGKETDMFWLIERSYIGILNNAIIREYGPQASSLQEFAVWNNGKVVGRADLLVKMNFEDQNAYFLFEGKQREFDGKEYSESETELFFDAFVQQGKKYYEAEKDDYDEKVFIVPIIFEWVRTQNKLDKLLSWDKYNKHSDFYMVLHSNDSGEVNSGLMVYGKVSDTAKMQGL